MDPIPGAAELSCQFRDPEAEGNVIQDREVQLLVTIKSAASDVQYTLTDAVEQFPDSQFTDRSQHAIRKKAVWQLRADVDSTYREIYEYVLSLEIDPAAPPRDHDIQLTFTAPNKTPVRRIIRFFVVAKDKGAFVDAAAATTSTPSIIAGTNSPFADDFEQVPLLSSRRPAH